MKKELFYSKRFEKGKEEKKTLRDSEREIRIERYIKSKTDKKRKFVCLGGERERERERERKRQRDT